VGTSVCAVWCVISYKIIMRSVRTNPSYRSIYLFIYPRSVRSIFSGSGLEGAINFSDLTASNKSFISDSCIFSWILLVISKTVILLVSILSTLEFS